MNTTYRTWKRHFRQLLTMSCRWSAPCSVQQSHQIYRLTPNPRRAPFVAVVLAGAHPITTGPKRLYLKGFARYPTPILTMVTNVRAPTVGIRSICAATGVSIHRNSPYASSSSSGHTIRQPCTDAVIACSTGPTTTMTTSESRSPRWHDDLRYCWSPRCSAAPTLSVPLASSLRSKWPTTQTGFMKGQTCVYSTFNEQYRWSHSQRPYLSVQLETHMSRRETDITLQTCQLFACDVRN